MRRRLLFGYLTITILVLLILEIPLGFAYYNSEQRRLRSDVQHDALALSIRLHESVESNQDAALKKIVNDYALSVGGRVVVVGPSGALLADSNPLPGSTSSRSFADRPEFIKALGGSEANGTRFSNTLGRDLLYVAVPLVSNGAVIGAVRLSFETSYVTNRIQRVWIGLAALAVAILALVFLVSLRLARIVTQPVSALEAAAKKLGTGDLTARAAVPESPAELRVLAISFNTTAARLESLVESQRAFVADASHQLRTPLQALRLRLENLEHDVADGIPADSRDLEGSLAEVARMSRLVDGLLILARAEQQLSAPIQTDVAELVSERIDAWSAFADDQGVNITSTVALGLNACITSGNLEQALDNLLSNAIEASPSGGAVIISSSANESGSVLLTVSDSGGGMTPEQIDRAFDRFWRPAGAGSGGSGLGLAIVRGLIEADGGSVELAPSPNGGLAVLMSLKSS
ncbi:MAG: ATP-binding protein [Actinomycetes bacterium]